MAARGRVESSGGKVAWGQKFQDRDHEESNGHRKVEISGLHS